MVELLPCPFCGGDDVDWTFPNDDDNDISVVCNSCTARGPETKANWEKDERDSSIQKAIELWNRRVPQSAHDDVKRWWDSLGITPLTQCEFCCILESVAGSIGGGLFG